MWFSALLPLSICKIFNISKYDFGSTILFYKFYSNENLHQNALQKRAPIITVVFLVHVFNQGTTKVHATYQQSQF